jgi:putative adhesin
MKPPRANCLLAIILLGQALVASGLRAEPPLQAQTEDFYPLPLDGAITLENSGGSFHVFSWYEPRVRLVAVRNAYTKRRLEQIRVEKKLGPRSLAVATVIPPVSGFFADRSGTVDYTITVPETAHLKLKLGAGEITLEGLRGGRAEIELTNGRVVARNCFANVRAHSTNGVLEVIYEWWENLPAAFDFAVRHGRIGAQLPFDARFQVDAQTANGRIGNGFSLQPTTHEPGQSLQGRTAPQAPVSMKLRTGAGNISIDSWR